MMLPSEHESGLGLLHAQQRGLNAAAAVVSEHEVRAGEAESALSRVQSAHPQWSEPSLRVLIPVLLSLIPVPATLLLDFFLAGASAHEIARKAGLPTALAQASRFVIPIIFVTLDLSLSARLVIARAEAQRSGALDAERLVRGLTLIGLLFVGAISALVLAAQLPRFQQVHSYGTATAAVLLVALVAITAISHGFLLLCGKTMIEALAYLTHRMSHRRLARSAALAQAQLRRGLERVRDQFDRLSANQDVFNVTYPSTPFLPRLSREARRQLQLIYGVGTSVISDERPSTRAPASPPQDAEDAPGRRSGLDEHEVRV